MDRNKCNTNHNYC